MKPKKYLALVMCMLLVCAVLTSCGGQEASGRRVSGTYERVYDFDFITKRYDMFEGGVSFFFLMPEERNSITMNEDGTYEYSKKVFSSGGFSFGGESDTGAEQQCIISFVFTGKYTDGSTETSYRLGKPEAVAWEITDSAAMIGFAAGSGDNSSPVTPEGTAPVKYAMDYFCGEVVCYDPVDGRDDADIWVEVELADSEFTYVNANSVYDIY